MARPRVISLVPSLTETCVDLGHPPERLIGRTPWCVRPSPVVDSIPVVGGTKTPNLARIFALAPDLVLLDREENPKPVYDQLVAEGLTVFVSDAKTVAAVPAMLTALGDALGCAQSARQQVLALEAQRAAIEDGLADDSRRPRALPLIWHDPLMALEAHRYGGDLVRTVGFAVPTVDPASNGYPVVGPERLGALALDHLLFTSEPHDFQPAEIEDLTRRVAAHCAVAVQGHKVHGEALTWFGTGTLRGLSWFQAFRAHLLDGAAPPPPPPPPLIRA